MHIKDINGNAVKKITGAKRALFRYHNKNNTGGNFGFEIRVWEGKDWEIVGNYDKEGIVYMLGLSLLYRNKVYNRITAETTINEILNILKIMGNK